VRAALEAEPERDHEATVAGAVEFFQATAKGLDNRVMLAMLQSLNLMIGESLRHVIARAPKAKDRILNAQKKLIEAFDARDSDLAAEWMEKHIADLKRGYEVAKVDMDEAIL
jgi:DNA-binding FadR family transcriptional regulator